MTLHQLAYVSTTRSGLPAGELRSILEVSVHNNSRDGITGILLLAECNVIQVLEGDQTAVEVAFERIRHDPRHHHVIQLFSHPIAVREFGDWAMRLQAVSMRDLSWDPVLLALIDKHPDVATFSRHPGMATGVIRNFVDTMDRSNGLLRI